MKQTNFKLFTYNSSANSTCTIVYPITCVVTPITVSPLWVRITTPHRPLVAGRTYDLVCNAVGGRPPTSLIWKMGNTLLTNYTSEVRHSKMTGEY